jgi:hypothetical protein
MREWAKLVDSPIFRRRLQISLAKSISHVVQFVDIFNTEIRGPTGVILHQSDLYLSHILAFMHIL